MNHRKALAGLLCATASVPHYCAGTTHAHLTTPLGNYGFELAYVKDNASAPSLTVTTQLPPGSPGGTITVSGRSVTLPANPTTEPWPITIEAEDPIILQVPTGWTIAEAKVTTSAGTGDVIILPANVPSRVQINANGTASGADYFAAEPGYDLYFLNMPPGLWAASMITGFIRFDVPVGERRVDELKFIETWRMDVVSPSGQIHTCYTPIGPDEFDFAQVLDLAHTFVVDTTTLPCAGPGGTSPTMELPQNDWIIGTSTSVDAANLDPSALGLLLWGENDLATPITLPTGLSPAGCKLMINYAGIIPAPINSNGTASSPIAVPLSPSLVGTSLVWQAAELHPAVFDIVTGTVLKVRVEP